MPQTFSQLPSNRSIDDPIKVLIVEDEVMVAMELQDHLELLGYEVLDTIASGEKAVEASRSMSPDLILMDIQLEGKIDGIEAARQIRSQQNMMIIFLTAYGDRETLGRAKETSPFGYLLKPFDERSLFAAIEVALHKQKLERQLQQKNEELSHILNSLHIGTVMVQAGGTISFINNKACELLGQNREVSLGKSWKSVFPMNRNVLGRLNVMATLPPEERKEITTRVDLDDSIQHWIKIDIQNNPYSATNRLFVLYDETEVYGLRRMLSGKAYFHNIVGKSAEMQEVFELIKQVGAVESTVLIEGDTGTGKELVARAIHNSGSRKDKPFIAVNCAALSDELASSQLFGHRKGAFTGALDNHTGLFEAANGGTIFLDEIGDISPEVQVKLLRVLEESEILPVGETQPRSIDVRVIAATHRNLHQLVREGKFRQDLVYRIRIARVELPPLNQRRADIPLLVKNFLQQCHAKTGKLITEASNEALGMLLEYHWPGNVRELRNVIEYAVIRSKGDTINVEDLPPEIRNPEPLQFTTGPVHSQDERGRILAALEQTGGHRTEAAKLLGISRATFYRRLEEYGIEA